MEETCFNKIKETVYQHLNDVLSISTPDVIHVNIPYIKKN